MLPVYSDGDFVLTTKFPFCLRRLKVGDAIVFGHDTYGILIKKITGILPGQLFKVIGNNPDSLNSDKLGLIPYSAILGKVIFHIRQNA